MRKLVRAVVSGFVLPGGALCRVYYQLCDVELDTEYRGISAGLDRSSESSDVKPAAMSKSLIPTATSNICMPGVIIATCAPLELIMISTDCSSSQFGHAASGSSEWILARRAFGARPTSTTPAPQGARYARAACWPGCPYSDQPFAILSIVFASLMS